MSDTLKTILVKPTSTVAEIDAQIKTLQKAKQAARMAGRKRTLPPFETLTLDNEALDDAGRPLVTVAFRPFIQPSVDNGYGALIVASSEVMGKSYVAAGAIVGGPYDGKVLEVSWKARIADAPTNK